LISESNRLNRKLEEVLGLGKEFETISNLWGKFHALAQEQPSGLEADQAVDGGGIPGTGGHVSQAARKSVASK
jgi:DASH complex subunit DAD1